MTVPFDGIAADTPGMVAAAPQARGRPDEGNRQDRDLTAVAVAGL